LFKNKPILQLIIGTLVLLFLGLIYAWSIFGASLATTFPSLSVSQLSMTFTISIISFTLFSFFGGLLLKKHQARLNLILTACMLLVGFWLSSLIDPKYPIKSLYRLYFFYGVLCSGGVGIGYNCVLSTVKKCFPNNVGLSSGIMLLGFGFGGLVLGSVVSLMITALGIYQVFRILAVAIFAIIILSSFVLVGPDETSHGQTATGVSTVKSLTPLEMLCDLRFWLYFIWAIIITAAGLMVIGNAVNISFFYGGTAILGLLISLANGSGRVVSGAMNDKFGVVFTLFCDSVLLLIGGALLVFGAKTSNLLVVICSMILVGIAYGGKSASSAAYANAAFGEKYYAINFSLVNFNLIPAAIMGPIMSARLIEKSDGAYGSTFLAVVVLALISILILIVFSHVDKSATHASKFPKSQGRKKKLGYAGAK
jgi:OFA family oxalate/formate antiporter-like MFS transporter